MNAEVISRHHNKQDHDTAYRNYKLAFSLPYRQRAKLGYCNLRVSAWERIARGSFYCIARRNYSRVSYPRTVHAKGIFEHLRDEIANTNVHSEHNAHFFIYAPIYHGDDDIDSNAKHHIGYETKKSVEKTTRAFSYFLKPQKIFNIHQRSTPKVNYFGS